MFFSEKQQLNIAKCKFVKEFKPSDASSSRRKRRHDDDSDSDDRSSDDEIATGSRRFQEADRRDGEDRRRRDDSPTPPPPPEVSALPPMPNVSAEERARLEREFAEKEAERAKKREEELKRLEAERKAHEERERIRKAKIGNAFLVGGEDEEEVPASVLARQPLVEKKYEERRPQEEEGIGYARPLGTASTSKNDAVVTAASMSAIQTMGGDSIVNEAQQILQKGAGVFLASSKGRKSRSRSRRRRSPSSSSSKPRKKDRRNERGGDDQRRRRTWDSLRSPTPDGHLRGQMRAARKAKMMAQMLQQGNVPRVS